MKEFNTTGVCVPSKHYMVDISDKLEQMIVLIEKGKYFTMNRSRQYGKTTTLASLYRRLKEKYIVLRLSFEGLGEEAFADSRAFVEMFIDAVADFWNLVYEDEIPMKAWTDRSVFLEFPQKDSFDLLGKKITKLCQQTDREILLFVDEVDKSSDNQIFLNFLGMLRNKYLRREEGLDDTFKSVILAGVYDVKNLKLMLRPEEEKKYNSPWNVAVDFNIDMSFSPEEIATMLKEYESDYHTGMDIMEVSGEIYKYTSGYPYLVSYICQWIDTKGEREFQTDNIRKAVNYLIREGGTLVDDLIKNYENVQGLQNIVDQMLFCGQEFACVKTNPAISLGFTFGIFKEKDTMLAISNLIFEDILINHVSSKKQQEGLIKVPSRNQFVKDGILDMELVLEKFQEFMKSEYRKEDEKFVEQQGRLLFLCFLKPIINGTGFYYVEPETRNHERMDIVVTYGSEEFIIELKIWHGNKYRSDSIKQLEQYMDSRSAQKGYLISFSFLKEKQYTMGMISEKETNRNIFEVIV